MDMKYCASPTNEDLRELIHNTLTSYRLGFRKLANKVKTHRRSNAGKISKKKVKSCNVLFIFIV